MRSDSQAFTLSDVLLEQPWLTAILDQIPVGIGLFDPEGQLFHANRLFSEKTDDQGLSKSTTWQAFSADGSRLDDHVFPCVRVMSDPIVPARESALDSVETLGRPGIPLAGASDNQTGTEAHLRRFAEHSSSAILIAEVTTGNIDFLSPAAQRIWASGLCLETVSDWEGSIHAEDRAAAIERRALVNRGFLQRFQYRIIDQHGEVTHLVRETCFPMPSTDGSAAAIGSIIEDISPEVPVYLVAPAQAQDQALFQEFRQSGQRVTTFSCQQELMNVADVLNPGCVVIDLRGSETSIEALLRLLHLRPTELQIILLGSDDTSPQQVITALKAGAADYLLEPLTGETLSRAIRGASQMLSGHVSSKDDSTSSLNHRLSGLPPREREVFLGLIGGGTNKSIARKLNLSPRTVETHRAHLMQRLNVRTLTDLLHLARDAGFKNSTAPEE